jgi:HEPN domain-containing protein
MTKKELDVFLSSDQEEFARLRNSLSKTACSIPFLTCTPLENRGADPTNIVESSLKAVRDSDIYVGIFGSKYSETTIKEYKEAVKYRKPCLTYVKKVKKRETKLSEFVDDNLKNEFHYFEFRTNKNLIAQVDIDLRRFIFETLRIGLEERAKKKEETRSIEEKALSVINKTLPSTPPPKDPLISAESAFRKGNYLECLVMTTVTIEKGLQNMLLAKGLPIRVRSLGELIQLAKRAQLLNAKDLESLRTISIYRNIAVHLGDAPSKKETRWILETAKKILARLGVTERL